MKIQMLVATGLAVLTASQSAVSATASSHGALALSALVGSYSTLLTAQEKAVLSQLLDGKTTASRYKATITINADSVICRAGDVDITAFACELTFGVEKLALTGRQASELFATLGEAGVFAEGAAGTIYESLHAMSCVVDPAAIARRDGSGATCTFAPGPP
jgi:hypothetical protein